MALLVINLLGQFSVSGTQGPINSFSTTKVRALLAYLAVEGTRPLDRSHLAGLLWPDVLEESARGNLRHALSNLRKVLGDQQAQPPYLQVTRRTIQLHPAGEIQIDVTEFQQLCRSAATEPDTQPETIDAAIALYRGPFLAGDLVDDSPEFEQWAQLQRDRLHRQMAELLTQVAQRALNAGGFAHAITVAQQLVDHEPWREESHVQLMNALWHAGQGDAAMRQFETCCQLLAEELAVEPAAETVALYTAIRDDRTAFQPVAPIHVPAGVADIAQGAKQAVTHVEAQPSEEEVHPRHNLPLLLKPFFGREAELAEIAQLLARPNCRQVTIIGPGGMGKSQLAQEYARRHHADFIDGVWFVPLAGVADESGVPAAIAEALGIALTIEQDSQSRVLHYLRDKELLLVLDNFEHLTHSATLVADILRQALAVSLLITTRERLNLQFETILPLGGLDLPMQNDQTKLPPTFEQAQASSAVQCFVDCATRADSGFALTTENADAVVAICQLTEGMPLGIELAAVWTRVLPCGEIYASLKQSMDLLSTSGADLPARHRSVRALLEETWQQLSPLAQQTFARLSIFRGGCDWQAVQQVTDASLFEIADLIDRSLLRKLPDGSFQIHELLRQFGAEQLAKLPSVATETAQRHAIYYATYLAGKRTSLMGRDQALVVAEITAVIDNIHVAWQWLRSTRDYTRMAAMAFGLFHYYESAGATAEGAGRFDRACQSLLQDLEAPLPLLVTLRNYTAAFLLPLGQRQRSEELLLENQCMARANQLKNALGWTQFYLGKLYIMSDTAAAAQHLTEATHHFRATVDDIGLVQALVTLSHLGSRQLDLENALRYVEEALTLARRLDATLLIATAVEQQGLVFMNMANTQQEPAYFTRAEACMQEALGLVRHLNNRMLEADYTNDLALVATYQGEYAHACALLQTSVDLFHSAGFEMGQALIAEENLARLQYILGNYAAAAAGFCTVTTKSREVGNQLYVLRSQQGLALTLLQQGNSIGARHALAATLDSNYLNDAPRVVGQILITAVQLLIHETAYQRAAQILSYYARHHHLGRNPMVDEEAILAQLHAQLGEATYTALAATVENATLPEIFTLIVKLPQSDKIERR